MDELTFDRDSDDPDAVDASKVKTRATTETIC
jgi:hypothetical protein